MKKRILTLLLALSLLLTSCGGRAKATTMHLMRTEGTVGVSDGGGKDVTSRENLSLYSGYGVDTSAKSYAWINLDDVKLTKMDEDSEIAITKEGKKLDIEVKSGSMFFNVVQPLADDESMDIRTSSMIVGIRGTCGWVQSDGDKGAKVFILEGTVEVEAIATGETVSVSAGEMAEVTVNENGETEITVHSFSEEYIAPFVLTELKDDEELSAAVLEASGLDAQNPPDPAERLRADYQAIIADRPIFDDGVAEGVSYTAERITYASEGLGDAVLVDLNSDGLDELMLLTRKAEGIWWGDDEFRGVCTQMEIYGSVMGRAALYDSVTFNESDYPSRLPRVFRMFHMASGDGRPCIYMYGGYQAVEDERLWALENNKLTLVESGYFDQTGYVGFTEEEYTILELPELPESSRQKTAYLYVLTEDYVPYAELTDLNQDGIDEMIVLEQYLGDDYFRFNVYSWDGAAIQSTEYETDIVYAKRIDMNRDGKEDLLLIKDSGMAEITSNSDLHENRYAIVCSWDSTGIQKTQLDIKLTGLDYDYIIPEGIYRNKVSGDIYVSTNWRGMGRYCSLVSLTDSVELGYAEFIPADYGDTSPENLALIREMEETAARQREEVERQLEQFEMIESFDFNSYEWINSLTHTVEEVQQQLMKR